MSAWFSELQAKFVNDFIVDNRYMYIVDGLKTTLIVTFMALILGLILGALVALSAPVTARCVRRVKEDSADFF